METPRPHILSTALAAAVTLASLGAHASAQTVTIPGRDSPERPDSQPEPLPESQPSPDRRPRAAQRTVAVFDFEDQRSSSLDVPAGWVRAQHDPLVPRDRPGFPIWNLARLDFTVAASGQGSLRCDVEGGSASLRLKPGELPVFPMGEYAVRAMVRTEGLVNARPRLVVRALDREGRPIPGSQRQTIVETLDTEWQPVEVVLPGVFADAAYLQIDLEVIQPQEFRRESLLQHQVWAQDFDGAAWFDDVVIRQVPQLHLKTTSPLNVVSRPDTPTLATDMRDLAAEELVATTRVYDARRALVAESTRAIRTGRESWQWTPDLPELGWFRAEVELASAGLVVAKKTCEFVWLETPKEHRTRYRTGPGFDGDATRATFIPSGGLGIQLTALPPGEPAEIARALQTLGVDHVTLPVWERGLRERDVPAHVDRLRAIITALRAAWIEPRLSLPFAPDELARPLRLRPGDVLDVMALDPAVWSPYLADAADRLGTSATRWQIGASGSGAIHDHANAVALLATLRAELARLIPGVEIAGGWRIDLPADAAAGSGINAASVLLPPWTASAHLTEATEPWRDGVAVEYVLDPLTTRHHSERDVAAELVRRAARLWSTQTGSAELPAFDAAIAEPWEPAPGAHAIARPTVAAAVWRTIADQVRDRAFAGEWRVGRGLRCLVFAPLDGGTDRGGLLIAWREDAPDDRAHLTAALGDAPVTVTDVFGNTHTIAPQTDEEGTHQVHTVPLSAEPVFIEGIDTGLVRFLSSLAFESSTIQSVAGERTHEVVISNPWSVPASGRLIITEPGGYDDAARSRDRSWEITPRSIGFDVPAGETLRVPVTVSFSRAIEAGPIDIVFDTDLVAEREYGWVRSGVPGEIALDGIELDVAYRKPAAAPDADLIVEATVTNTGQSTRSFDAFAFGPGMPRVRASIGSLEPGQSVVRYFPFPKAAAALRGQRVVVSIAEAEGPGRLTKGVDVLAR
ncbi:MAG: hypothetical protein ACF8LK_04175 [Phycisphaerales bacterium JB041]